MSFLLQGCRSFVVQTSFLSGRTVGTKRFLLATTSGKIEFFNEQKTLKNINEERLLTTITKLRSILGYDHYSVTLALVEDEKMVELNSFGRNIKEPTDILSFPMYEAIEPGVLVPPHADVPDLINLGDMMIDVPYVIRQCKEDEEWEYEDEDDRGVSAAMAEVFDPEQRLHMLLVHGMLHLVGYDHIEDDDYEVMVTKEDEILKELGLVPGKE